MSPGPLNPVAHTIRDLRPGQGEVDWPALEHLWWVTMIDETPAADWPHEVLWVFVRQDRTVYHPWASTYPPEIYDLEGTHIPLHCLPLSLEGLGICRD
jgi:hypothetical protein